MRPFTPLATAMMLMLAAPVLATPVQSAHEAAHVIQQQGGVGRTGDAYEKHGDHAAPISVNEPGLPATPTDRTRTGKKAPSSGSGGQPQSQAEEGRGRCQLGKCATAPASSGVSEVIADQTPAAPQPWR